MTIKDILKALGIEDAIIQQVEERMKSEKIYTTSHENMDARYPKLKGQYDTAIKDLDDLRKANEGSAEMAGKIAAFEQEKQQHDQLVQQLQTELAQAQIRGQVREHLVQRGAVDVDYLMYVMENNGDPLTLDDKKQVINLKDRLDALQTQKPSMFASAGKQKVRELPLPDNSNAHGVSKEEFNRMGYQERLKLYNENPEAYEQLNKN